MKFPLFVLIAFLFLILFSVHSQQTEWRQFTAEDGMSDDIVLSIHQSKAGDIWISTAKGLDRFSGTFEIYIHRNPVIRLDLFESSSGQLVANMESRVTNDKVSVVYLFDGIEWETSDFFDDNDILVYTVPEFAAATSGKLWLSSSDGLIGFDCQK